MISFNLKYLLRILSPETVTLGVRASAYELWRNIIQSMVSVTNLLPKTLTHIEQSELQTTCHWGAEKHSSSRIIKCSGMTPHTGYQGHNRGHVGKNSILYSRVGHLRRDSNIIISNNTAHDRKEDWDQNKTTYKKDLILTSPTTAWYGKIFKIYKVKKGWQTVYGIWPPLYN